MIETHNEVIGSVSVAVHLYGDNVALTVFVLFVFLNTGSVRVFSKEVDEYFIMQQFCLHFMLSGNREIQSQLQNYEKLHYKHQIHVRLRFRCCRCVK